MLDSKSEKPGVSESGTQLPDLRRLSILARRGSSLGAWRVWQAVAGSADGMSLEELAQALPGVERHDLEADAALLVAHGAVIREGERYQTTDGGHILRSTGIADSSQHGLEALRLLVEDILPEVERHPPNGAIVTGFLDVPAGEGRRFWLETLKVVKKLWAEAQESKGPERANFVLGLAVKPAKQGEGEPE